MTLNFTKQELLHLLKLAAIGDWVKHCEEIPSETEDEDTPLDNKVMQKLMAAVFKAKMMGVVEYDMQAKRYTETRQFEDDKMEDIEAFSENSFWDQLSDKLAKRDLFLKYGADKIDEMDVMEYMLELSEIAGKYDDIFAADGLLNVVIADKNKTTH